MNLIYGVFSVLFGAGMIAGFILYVYVKSAAPIALVVALIPGVALFVVAAELTCLGVAFVMAGLWLP